MREGDSRYWPREKASLRKGTDWMSWHWCYVHRQWSRDGGKEDTGQYEVEKEESQHST